MRFIGVVFAMLNRILDALKEIGIQKLTEFQIKARELILSGKDVILVAPTGSGKTEAVIVPIFEKILCSERKGVSLLYITPLRALNRDMLRRLLKLANRLGISVDVRHGDTPSSRRSKQSKNPPEVMITTPETFQILFLGKRLKEIIKNVRFVVIDEIHELADSERGAQLTVALERLKEYTKFQTIALSATVSDAKKIAKFFGMTAEILYGEEDKFYEFFILSSEDDIAKIKELIEKNHSTLVFVNTRQTAEALGVKLKEFCKVEVHHGSLSREAREEAEEKFTKGELKALICTSSMELGIDVGHVDAVIQYNSPRQVVRLLQRVGRSGHKIGQVSRGFIVASNFDEIIESAAIVDFAKKGILEDPEFHYSSLDVIANQISAIALEYGRIGVEKLYSIIRRAEPFKNITFEDFDEICKFLNDIGRIFYDGELVAARRATRKYFYDNISMIPDERHYRVVNIINGKSIGVLDESFLSTFSGEVFAMKGELWRVVSVEDVVKVEPYTGEGQIPSWAGEEIPVPFEIAQRVGELRKEVAEKGGKFLKEYGLNDKAIEKVEEVIEEHKKSFPLPTNNHITIEGVGEVVINACFGHKVNEALGRILALLISLKKGKSVSVEIDPYRIKLTPTNALEVKNILIDIKPEDVESYAERALVDTKLMQWKVVNVARKFGILDKSDDISRINLKNLVLKLRDTPAYREALREIFLEKLDIKRLKTILEKLGSEITFSVHEKLSPISLVERSAAYDILSVRSNEAILKAFKERIENEITRVRCVNCGSTYAERVGSFSRFSCVKCGSKMIAVYNSKREEPKRGELLRIANLVMCYGKKAVYALNTYGIGAETAARILSKHYSSDEDFFKALLKAERDFIRTRKFWD
ncbi:MAG: DEAD/DEAH box helicase [Archaeoglobaceae archaeon]